jgi:hypothetical protein
MRRGVGETRGAQIPGSYIRAAAFERNVISLSHAPRGTGCVEKCDRFRCAVGGRRGGIPADDGQAAGCLAAKLRALVLGERIVERRDPVRRNAAQALLVSTDRRYLRDNAA